MQARSLRGALILAPALALCGLRSAEAPRFDVEPGTRIVREFELEHYLELKALESLVDGVETSTPARAEVSSTQRLLAFDEVRESADGRPTVLRRLFDKIAASAALRSGAAEGETTLVSLTGKSPLEGVGVVYTWVPEAREWARYFDALEVDEGALADLRQDLDALAFLPPPGHVEGAWSVPAEAVRGIFAPAGDLSIEFDATQGGSLVRPLRVGLGANLQHALAGDVEGQVELRWAEPREEAGRRLAVATVTVKISCAADQSARFRSSLTFTEFSSGMTVDSALSTWTFEGRGELAWDASTGYLAKLELEGEQGHTLRWRGAVPAPDGAGKQAVDETVRFQGTLHVHGGGTPKR